MAEADRWLAWAEDDIELADFAVSRRMWRQACFHSQQAVEKAITRCPDALPGVGPEGEPSRDDAERAVREAKAVLADVRRE